MNPSLRAPTAHFVSLPNRGGDPVCGLSRSTWYKLERIGLITLTRIRLPGHQRGRVLIPVPQAVALMKRMSEEKPKLIGPNRKGGAPCTRK